MKIILFSTQTIHHTYFVAEVNKYFAIERVVLQEKSLQPPFDTFHSFESEREQFEVRECFNGEHKLISDYAEVLKVDNINDEVVINYLEDNSFDLIIVFGTGKISKKITDLYAGKIINLHGGDPERYRGLDSHLWSIYHKDFNSLVTSLHFVNSKLDDGEIIMQSQIELFKNMKLYMLRKYNTDCCIELVLNALDMFKNYKKFTYRKQSRIGRYYSFMPAVIKNQCMKYFDDHCERIV